MPKEENMSKYFHMPSNILGSHADFLPKPYLLGGGWDYRLSLTPEQWSSYTMLDHTILKSIYFLLKMLDEFELQQAFREGKTKESGLVTTFRSLNRNCLVPGVFRECDIRRAAQVMKAYEGYHQWAEACSRDITVYRRILPYWLVDTKASGFVRFSVKLKYPSFGKEDEVIWTDGEAVIWVEEMNFKAIYHGERIDRFSFETDPFQFLEQKDWLEKAADSYRPTLVEVFDDSLKLAIRNRRLNKGNAYYLDDKWCAHHVRHVKGLSGADLQATINMFLDYICPHLVPQFTDFKIRVDENRPEIIKDNIPKV